MYTQIFRYRKYLLSAVILAIIFGSMYGLVQQLGRMQANDMPTLLATQTVKIIDSYGVQAINSQPTDLANNPVPFVIVYDKQGKAVGGSGYLDKKLAVAPKSMLQHAKPGDNNVVTWQPKAGVRIASVTVATKDYYVLGGQSLKATEDHADKLLKLTMLGYGSSLAILAAYAIVRKYMPKP